MIDQPLARLLAPLGVIAALAAVRAVCIVAAITLALRLDLASAGSAVGHDTSAGAKTVRAKRHGDHQMAIRPVQVVLSA